MTIWADIHTHTTASDGSFTPTELVRHAKKCGLQGLSITDHDTIAAYEEAIPIAKELGIVLGTGIEFSTIFEGHDVHILGYDITLSSPELLALCHRHKNRRLHRNLKMLEKLHDHKMEITLDEMKGSGRPHIAYIMVQKGYVKSIKEAFNKYLGEGKKCYVRGDTVSVQETIDVIHAADGKAFIAHPHLLVHSFPITQLLELPFDGIECRYAKLASKTSEPWIKIAQQKKWLMSGGSDFHGAVKPDISLGCQGVDRATFDQIFTRQA